MVANTKSRTIVIDASFALGYLLPDERSKIIDDVFTNYASGRIHLVSTALLPFEVGNGLLAAVRTKRIDQKTAEKLFGAFEALAIELLSLNFSGLLQLAINKHLTVYDAGYLWLAKNRRVSILSLDRSLAASI